MAWVETALRPVLRRLSHVATAFIWLKGLTTEKALTCTCYEIQSGELFKVKLPMNAAMQ